VPSRNPLLGLSLSIGLPHRNPLLSCSVPLLAPYPLCLALNPHARLQVLLPSLRPSYMSGNHGGSRSNAGDVKQHIKDVSDQSANPRLEAFWSRSAPRKESESQPPSKKAKTSSLTGDLVPPAAYDKPKCIEIPRLDHAGLVTSTLSGFVDSALSAFKQGGVTYGFSLLNHPCCL
jgi:hypothetical protein